MYATHACVSLTLQWSQVRPVTFSLQIHWPVVTLHWLVRAPLASQPHSERKPHLLSKITWNFLPVNSPGQVTPPLQQFLKVVCCLLTNSTASKSFCAFDSFLLSLLSLPSSFPSLSTICSSPVYGSPYRGVLPLYHKGNGAAIPWEMLIK